MNNRILVSLFILIIVGLGLIYTEATDADLSAELVARGNSLRATTLEFSNRDTANESRSNSLFNISGLLPGGFDVKASRVKKDGQKNFKYSLSVQNTFGDDLLCHELQLEVWHNKESIYNDKLLSLNINSSIDNQGKDDWIFFISLPKDDKNLSLKFCEFDFKFSTFNDNPDEIGGFSDQKLLKNRVASGSW